MNRRALLLTTSFPRHPEDWAGRFVAESAADLARRGWRVRVLAPGHGWCPPGIERLSYRDPGGLFDGHGAPEALRRRPLVMGAAAVAAQAALIAAARRHTRPGEVLIGHWLVPGGPAALLAARVSRSPVHLVAHGSDVALLEQAPPALARRLDRADSITFVSADLAARFAARLGRPMRAVAHVRPMGIPDPAPDPAVVERLRALAGGRPVVATIGRLVPLKGFDVLLDALARLGADGLRPLWIAAGDGPEGDRLAAGAARAGVAFEPLGSVGPRARDALLAVADVCAVPSRPIGRRREGTPLVVLEALTAGAPLVASRVGGIPAVAGPAEALLVPPGDPAALAAALRRVLGEPALARRMARAHQNAGKSHRWSSIGAGHAAAWSDRRGCSIGG